MNDLERLALAGLVHDLPALTAGIKTPPSKEAECILDLARLDEPALVAILEQAEQYAMPRGAGRAQVTNQPLLSVFSLLQINQLQTPQSQYHQFAPLPSTTESQARLFPSAEADPAGLSAHVQELASQLDWLGSHVDLTQFDRAYHHLTAVLQRYGWCLPGHSPDAALLDHARLTSAIAACLYRYHEAQLTAEAIHNGAEAERFCLLVGDLSGIQDYIFGITTIGAGGVARRLRARSFYLSALSDVLSHLITDRFGVPLGNVIMSSGGKFYVLLPNRTGLDEGLQTLRREIDSWFREQFNGEIALNLAHVCFAGEMFQSSSQAQRGFGDVVTELSRKLNREKRRRGQGVLTQDGHWDEDAFLMKRDFRGVGVCVSCGKFPGNRPGTLCDQCERDVTIGRRLPRARYVAYYRQSAGEDAIPMPMGYSVQVWSADELAQAGQPYLLTKLNDPDIHELAGYPGAFRYLANHVPPGMSFEGIAAQSQGRHLLGYVKADVDTLGILFAQGLRRDEGGHDTATHIAALSRELDLFFSGWMQHLLSRVTDYNHFYTIFSGGDDLFLVGPWDKAAALAREVHDQFSSFVGHNSDLTLSAGVLFTKERYPISRAAQDAEDVLELSKEREWADGEGRKHTRNQLTVLGDTLRWDIAPGIFAEIEKLQKSSQRLTSAFLYDLIEYGRLYRLWAEEKKIEGLRYKPLFAYNIARNLRKEDTELYRWADALMQSLHGGQQNLTMQHLGLIATYLLFARRSG